MTWVIYLRLPIKLRARAKTSSLVTTSYKILFYFKIRNFKLVLFISRCYYSKFDHHEQNLVDKFLKLIKTDNSLEYFAPDISQFCNSFVKIWFWVVGWVFVINSKLFKHFLEIFFTNFQRYQVLSCLATRESTRPFPFLLIIIKFRFTCGETKLC